MNIDIMDYHNIMYVELRVKIAQIIVHVNVGNSHPDCRWYSCMLSQGIITSPMIFVYTGYTL